MSGWTGGYGQRGRNYNPTRNYNRRRRSNYNYHYNDVSYQDRTYNQTKYRGRNANRSRTRGRGRGRPRVRGRGKVYSNDRQSTKPKTNTITTWKKKDDLTKEYYRQKVWNYMEDNNIAIFPRPVFHRIPNFIGSDDAAKNLLKIPEFVASNIVKVNPDRPQTYARYLCLKRNKRLFVPPAALKQNGILTEIVIPNHLKTNDNILQYAATRKGFEQYGKLIRLNDLLNWDKYYKKIDVVIIGSVAIDKDSGYRIGKGEGFADMEIAIMNTFGLINKNTTFIATIHDCQLQYNVNMKLFDKITDTRLDYICTPTQVIKIKNKKIFDDKENVTNDEKKEEIDNDKLPYRIDWSKLTQKRINQIPFLRTLRDYMRNQ